MRVVALVLGGFALAAPHASAGGSWSEPVRLGPEGPSEVELGVGASGEALSAWTSANSSRGRVEVATRPLGGTFGQHEVVSGPIGLDADLRHLLVNARGDALVVWMQNGLFARFRPAGGSFGPIQRLTDHADFASDTAALGDDGHAIVGWSDDAGHFVAEQQPGGAFGSPRVVAVKDEPTSSYGLVVGVGGEGTAIAALVSGHPSGGEPAGGERQLLAAVRTPGEEWPATQVVGDGAPPDAPPVLAVAPSGEAVLAWGLARGPFFTPTAPRVLFAAVRPAGGEAFGPAVVMAQSDAGGVAQPVAVPASDGSLALAWTRYDGDSSRTELAMKRSGAPFTPAETIPGTTGALRIAFADGGRGLFAISRVSDHPATFLQVVRRVEGSWGTPIVLSATTPSPARMAFDEHGRGIGAWAEGNRLMTSAWDASAPDPATPRVESFGLEPYRFRAARPRGKKPVGATVKVRMSAPIDAIFAVRFAGGSRFELRRRRLLVGDNAFRFNGKVNGRPLEPGAYRLDLMGADIPGPRIATRTARFRILRDRRATRRKQATERSTRE